MVCFAIYFFLFECVVLKCKYLVEKLVVKLIIHKGLKTTVLNLKMVQSNIQYHIALCNLYWDPT